MLGDPRQRTVAQARSVADQLVNQAELERLACAEGLAFDDERLRTHQAEQPRRLRDSRRAGDQSERDFGRAELRLAIVDRDAMVRDQRDFPAAAERVQDFVIQLYKTARHHRLTQGLERAEILLHLLDFGEAARGIGRRQAHHALQVSAGEEGGLGRREHDAFDLR